MLKKLVRTLGLTSLLLSATSQALPIVQADAFVAGDNKAALETSTGLVWMDFGVNQHQTYAEVVSLLDSDYLGWRLPTATEVENLWTSLFIELFDWHSFGPGFAFLYNYDSHDDFDQIFDVFGYSGDLEQTLIDNETNTVVDTYVVRTLSGAFTKEPGVNGFANLYQAYDHSKPSSAFYYEFTNDISIWNGTFLVKDNAASVPEPSSLFLCLLGVLGLIARRRVLH